MGTNDTSHLYIGLMSGTSLDSIDSALVEFKNDRFHLIESLECHLPAPLREQLISLCQPGDNEIDRMGSADRELGRAFASTVKTLLKNSGKTAAEITAIGSHGQTIRHRPSGENGFTLQISDPNTIAFETGITTIADFRRRDIAANGQGAPLTPAFHKAAFSSKQHNRAIINIGGIANVTYLGSNGDTSGLDTGPGNTLMDSWIQKNRQQKYDDEGQWAASGTSNEALLAQLLSHPYLSKAQPKSTGREDFNVQWLQQILNQQNHKLAANDVQATLLEFSARTISNELNKLPQSINEIYICGGGAYNTQLMLRLETLLHPCIVANTSQLGIPAQWVEAVAFAWLAKQTIEKKPGNLHQVTGASRDVILGAVYPA